MKFTQILLLGGIAILLNGCLGKLETLTEETKNAVVDSKDVIDDTHHDQKLGGALNLLPEDIAMKSAAAETMFIMSADDRIYKYIGATMPLSFYMGIGNKFPNVSFIGTKGDSTKNLAPISPEKYEILEIATMRVLRELTYKSQTRLSDAELNDVKSKSMRMFLVSTALLGAKPGPVREARDAEAVQAVLENQAHNQEEASQLLMALASLFNDDVRGKVSRLIEVRFQNKSVQPGTLF